MASGGAANPQSWNRYAYASDDPVNGRDPSGLETCFYVDGVFDSCEDWWGIAGGYGVNSGPSFGYACMFGFIPGCNPNQIGAGGGGIPAGVQVGAAPAAPLTGVGEELKGAFSTLTNCANVFGGLTKVDNAAQSMVFWDGRQSGNMALAGDLTNTQSFATYHAQYPSATATTLLNIYGQASNSVVLWADFFAESQADQNVTLMHEFIHSFFNLTAGDHSDIVSKFKITVNPGETDSAAVDRWIKNDCKN